MGILSGIESRLRRLLGLRRPFFSREMFARYCLDLDIDTQKVLLSSLGAERSWFDDIDGQELVRDGGKFETIDSRFKHLTISEKWVEWRK
jgi:hypothetical protein